MAELWGVSPDQVKCDGCRVMDGNLPPFLPQDKPCRIYTCAKEKGVEFCYECPDFPCDNLHPVADCAAEAPHNTKVYNLCLIKKMGLEKWAEEKSLDVNKTYFNRKFKLT